MLAELDSREYSEWQAYEQVDGPLGPARLDILFAALQATVANAARTKRSSKTFAPKDFLLHWDNGRPQQTWQEQKAVVYQLNAVFGGTVKPAA